MWPAVRAWYSSAIGSVRGSSRPAVAAAAGGDDRVWVVSTEGFGDPDVLANFNICDTTAAITSYRRLLAGLTLRVEPRRLRKGKRTDLRFTVRDAGAAVK
jgi:hypothetical protein